MSHASTTAAAREVARGLEHISSILPRALRALAVTPGMFQTRQHYDAWIQGHPLLTQRPRRWRVPQRWKEAMYRHYGHRCVHCGATTSLTVGHIVPVKFGGSNEPSNIQPECMPCNAKQWTPECAALAKQLEQESAA